MHYLTSTHQNPQRSLAILSCCACVSLAMRRSSSLCAGHAPCEQTAKSSRQAKWASASEPAALYRVICAIGRNQSLVKFPLPSSLSAESIDDVLVALEKGIIASEITQTLSSSSMQATHIAIQASIIISFTIRTKSQQVLDNLLGHAMDFAHPY